MPVRPSPDFNGPEFPPHPPASPNAETRMRADSQFLADCERFGVKPTPRQHRLYRRDRAAWWARKSK